MGEGNLGNPQLVIFDLDGTLIDSAEDIALSVNELLDDLGRPALPLDTVRSYVGNGVRKLLERALATASTEPVREEDLDAAVAGYLPIYRRRLLDRTRPFPGVPEALDALARERSLAVLTNKPRRESVLILEGLSLARHFRAVYGGDSLPQRKPSPEGVHRLISELGTASDTTLFVGDSAVDMETARNASVRACLVTYGMDFAAAKRIGPDLVVDDLRELALAVTPR